ncbi:S-layer homology domain-containing protein [Paenibacillus sp. J5C_2022]|uniref:S-layer homology domain-containing protein n=1 Tax=Paenibacillus sp. J5C2022 TaxID=2977129 RepID=UPI0021D0CEF4|nr:S-layer homology domain-containing protein [Paenibacillus sp. J5C2022]MCU6711368.1 S-layer homology domain-containing protein [Paenibacillus sp. J5C2022]
MRASKKYESIRKKVCLLLAFILFIPLISIGGTASAASAGWSIIDGNGVNGINANPNYKAENPAMVEWNGEVYVAWQERGTQNSINQIRVKKYNETGWVSVDGNGPNGLNVDVSKVASRPAMAVYDGSLYIIWKEMETPSIGQIRIKKYDGLSWTSAEGNSSVGINVDASKTADFPALAVYRGDLYATWSEASQIRVKKYDGVEWTSVDGGGTNGLNIISAANAAFPVMAVMGDDLYLVWSEVSGANYQLRVKRYNGQSWELIDGGGSGLNMRSWCSALYPSATVIGNALYVGWHEPISGLYGTDDQIRVKKFEEGVWSSIDGGGEQGINVSPYFRAYYVEMAAIHNELYAIWTENTGTFVNGKYVFKIRVKKYDGTKWTNAEDGRNGLNVDGARPAFYPAVTVLDGALYVAWQEQNGTEEQVRVAQYSPPPPPAVNSVSVSPGTANIARGAGGQLTAEVDVVGGAATTVTWSSSDAANKVQVSGTGYVTVASDAELGDYTITATSTADSSKTGTATITVTYAPSVNGVTVTPDSASVMQGESRQLSATVDTVGGAATTVTWSSSDADNKVQVSGTGYVTVASDAELGDYTITATSTADSSKTGTATITVTYAPAVNGVTVTPDSASVMQGESRQLAATVDTVGGAATMVTWSSSDADHKVTVDETGNVTVAVDATPGVYTITATSTADSSKTGTSTITVTAAPTYTIASIANQTLTALTQGYASGTQDAQTIPVTNTGTGHLTNLSVTISGANANDFEITQPGSSLNSNESTSFTIQAQDSLQAGTYTVTVTVSADQMTAVTFTVSQSVNLPNAPANPQSLTAVGGNRQAVLNWNTVMGATYYNIYIATSPGQYIESEAATVTSATYNILNLINGTTYYFTVKAGNEGGLSAMSNEASATPATVPAAPTHMTAIAGDGQATVTFTAPADDGGSPITGYEVTAAPGSVVVSNSSSPIVVTGLSNGTSYTFTVKAINAVGISISSAESNAVVPRGESSRPSLPATTIPNTTNVDVLINGKVEHAGTATTSTRNGQSVRTIAVDQKRLEDKLAAEGQGAVITIPDRSNSNVVIGELNGQMVKSMESKQAIVAIKTDQATYTIPAQQFQIGDIAGKLGKSVDLQDIKVQIEIAEPATDTWKVVESATLGAFTIMVPPLEFTIRAIYGNTSVEVSKFNAYVERTIAIPAGVDPSKITTGVVVEPDGTVRHVPTKIVIIDGKYYARINSLTNSTYSVVWHPLEFLDAVNHWASIAVNDMGSRMVIDGTGGGLFSPDRDITRAEFAAIVVRGLGLKREDGSTVFSDVKTSDWFSGAINTAYAYQLIGGFEDGTFRPNDKITREQAMTILSRAMTITGLKAKLSAQSEAATLLLYEDASNVSGWALSGVADSVQAGLVTGRSAAELAPKAPITRAEVATIIQRLLQTSDLI